MNVIITYKYLAHCISNLEVKDTRITEMNQLRFSLILSDIQNIDNFRFCGREHAFLSVSCAYPKEMTSLFSF